MDFQEIKFKKEVLEKNKILIGGIAIALVFAWFGYSKIFLGVAASKQFIKQEIANENARTEVLTRLSALQADMQSYKVYFSGQKDISWLIDKVSAAADASGLDVVSLNPQPAASSGAFMRFALGISVKGTFHQLGDFVCAIENSREFIKIEKLSFRKTDKTLDADMLISTYFFERL